VTAPSVDWERPNFVCWQPATRAEVMNTIALDVRRSVFKATHFPSFLQQAGAAPGTFVPISEQELLDDFLREDHLHVFDVAVGDSGTGKSHLIRWIAAEIGQRNAQSGDAWWVVDVPRSSANLADVVRRVLHGFDTEVVSRLRAELDKDQDVSIEAAKTRVLDELAFVLERAHAERQWDVSNLNEIERIILELLPPMLRAREVRLALTGRSSGIITSLAQHVLGRRDSRDDLEAELRWHPTDLAFTPAEVSALGGAAGELAVMLMDDADARTDAVRFLNRAQPDALRNLLRFKKGDMQRALIEIRRALHAQNKDLILLIEDLSVTEGLNTELLEALQVRTRDTGEDLCRLRSMVGVTNEDHARMLENIRVGRTLRTVYFNVPVGATDEPTAVGVGPEAVRDFASRYLNAARYDLSQLDAWAVSDSGANVTATLPTACTDCPVRPVCHASFGAVDGRGLYPFSEAALDRLYRQVTGTAGGTTERSFNPRLLVGRVLSGVLEEAERTLPTGEFPGPTLANSFGLSGVRSEVQVLLREQLSSRAGRVQRALNLYAESPSSPKPKVSPGIAAAFQLPMLDVILDKGDRPEKDKEKVKDKDKEPPPKATPDDSYEVWLASGALNDRELNTWRRAIYEAVAARIDWDVEHLALVAERFKAGQISIDGQHTQIRGDQVLRVKRSPEAAIAIRALVEGLEALPLRDRSTALLHVRRRIDEWTASVRQLLRRYADEGEALAAPALAVDLLVLAARVRGRAATTAPAILAAALEPWQCEEQPTASQPWRGLVHAFRDRHEAVRLLLIKLLSCTKGARVGAIIDPSPVLEDLERALTAATPRAHPAESDRWVTFAPVRRLADDIEKHLARAVDEEAVRCGAWNDEMSALVGNAPVRALDEAKAALREAAAQGLIETRPNSDLIARLQAGAATGVGEVLDAVKQVARAKPGSVEQIVALGAIDRVATVRAVLLLRETGEVLDASTAKAYRLDGQSGDGDALAAESRARHWLASLDASLAASLTSAAGRTPTPRRNGGVHA
jgi:hypothetical protein